MSVKEIKAFQIDSGEIYTDKNVAEINDVRYQFRRWCQENICVGGEWSADMVADAILDNWSVKEKPF